MEINDKVFVRTEERGDPGNSGTVVDFSDGMVLVVFDGTGLIGRYLKAELALAGGGTFRENQSAERGGK